MNKEICMWTYDENYDVWETECKNSFQLNAGTPEDNMMKFCPYCGKKIKCLLG